MNKKVNVPVEEQETSINLARSSNSMNVWTNDTTMITFLKKFIDIKDSDYGIDGAVYLDIPLDKLDIKKVLKPTPKKRKKRSDAGKSRVISPEHLAKLQAGREKARA